MAGDDLPVYPTPHQAVKSHLVDGPRKPKTSYHQQTQPLQQHGGAGRQQTRPPPHSGHSQQSMASKYSQAPVQHQPQQPPQQQYYQQGPPPQQSSYGYQQQPQQQPPQQQYYQQAPQSHVQEQSYGLPPQQTPQQTYYQSTSPGSQYTHQQAPQPQPVQQHPNQPQDYRNHSPRYDTFSESGAPPKKSSTSSSFSTQLPVSKKGSKESLVYPTGQLTAKQKLENELKLVFEKVDVNRSGYISARELSSALLNFDHTRFQDSTIVLMINLFTNQDSPVKSLNFEQFVSLWKYLSAYKKLFIAADSDSSGDISFGEFQKILEQIGYKLNIDLVLHLFQKFSNKNYRTHEISNMSVGKLKFDAFIELLVYLRKLTDVFKKYDTDLSGVATIKFSDFLFEVSNLS